MAQTATASDLQIERSLRGARFADAAQMRSIGQTPAIDPSVMATSQSTVSQDIDALRRQQSLRGTQGEAEQGVQSRNPITRLAALRSAVRAQASAAPSQLGAQVVNKAYAQYVGIFQSELLANVLALEVFVSPWLFLAIFTLRIFSGFFPVQARGVRLIPPYSMRTAAGIGQFIGHLAGAMLILLVLTIIVMFIMLVAWFLTAPVLDKIKATIDVGGGALKVLYDLFTST